MMNAAETKNKKLCSQILCERSESSIWSKFFSNGEKNSSLLGPKGNQFVTMNEGKSLFSLTTKFSSFVIEKCYRTRTQNLPGRWDRK